MAPADIGSSRINFEKFRSAFECYFCSISIHFVCSAGGAGHRTAVYHVTWYQLTTLFRGWLKPNEYSYIPMTNKANEWLNWALRNRTKLNQKLNLNHSLTNWRVN